jgi:hypothetical protein
VNVEVGNAADAPDVSFRSSSSRKRVASRDSLLGTPALHAFLSERCRSDIEDCVLRRGLNGIKDNDDIADGRCCDRHPPPDHAASSTILKHPYLPCRIGGSNGRSKWGGTRQGIASAIPDRLARFRAVKYSFLSPLACCRGLHRKAVPNLALPPRHVTVAISSFPRVPSGSLA